MKRASVDQSALPPARGPKPSGGIAAIGRTNGTYLLADDLSGALEAGGAFREGGRSVALTFDENVAPVASETLQVISSETRNAAPAIAAATVARILRAQRARANQLLFKKIDSTLRGPCGAEIRALIETLAPPLVVVCPANPAVGRTVRDGCLLVRGVPVAETEFRQDPVWPVRESRVADVLAADGVVGVTALSLGELRSSTALSLRHLRGVIVSDAETREDLERLVQHARRSEPAAVFVGSGGLAHALAAGAKGQGPVEWKVPPRVLVVSGSKHAASRRQLEILRDEHAVPLYTIDAAPDHDPIIAAEIIRALSARGAASLTLAKNFSASDPGAPIRRLTEMVTRLSAAGAEPAALAATGGETARALCVALGISRLDLIGEVERGVVVAGAIGKAGSGLSTVVIKPGGFGSDKIWTAIIRREATQSMK